MMVSKAASVKLEDVKALYERNMEDVKASYERKLVEEVTTAHDE